jgi:hypothetical protein
MFDVEETLLALNIDYTTRNVEANALCPMHERMTGRPDGNPSWWINLETGAHICFSCHYKGNLLQLVCDVHEFYIKLPDGSYGYDYAAGKSWLANASDTPVERLLEHLKAIPRFIQPIPKPVPMSEARLAVFVDPPQEELDKRGILLPKAQDLGILWDAKKKTWILPLRHPGTNSLMGWQEKGTVSRTFMNRPAGIAKSTTLFGVQTLQDNEPVVVVESPLDVAHILSTGWKAPVVAVCGSSMSEDQVKLLRNSSTLIAAFDNPNIDKAGKKACDELQVLARKYGLMVYYFNYGDSNAKDPGDLNAEQIRWGIENAKAGIYGESAYVYRDTEAIPG